MSSEIFTRNRIRNKHLKLLIISVLSILILGSVASAAVYRWIPSNGVTILTEITTDWGSCGTNPVTNRTTLLTDSSISGCSSDSITSGIPDPVGEKYPLVEMFFNTSYSQDTDVKGNWYFGRINNAGVTPTTYTFYLIYALPDGTRTTLPGTGSLTISGSSDLNYNISLAAINGIVPKDAKLGLKITKSVQWNRYLWFGDSAGKGGVASGYFSVTETVPGALTFNISGYVTNGSSGFPLEGVFVQTNTSIITGTNSQGYYLFSGLTNGSYLIEASLSGYVANSTGATISGANMANINISLSPESEYLLSGYVKEHSIGDAIANVVVMTDNDLVTTTNSSGYYEFLVRNGTFLITASKSSYDDGFIEVTVNGAAVGNSNITLTSILPPVGKILVSTNRYVILDDPIDNSKTAQTTANFSLPSYTGWSTTNNQWSGIQTQIKGYALLIDAKGTPVPYSNLTFTLSNWNGVSSETSPVITTDANGVANYTFDMNARNYYGNWNITANASGKTASSGFIYNWWGCNAAGCYNHQSDTAGSANSGRQNSPYTLGRESITANSNHGTARNDNNCVGCHRSYGGTGGGNQFTGQPTKTSDVHTTNTCATCHNISTVHTTDVKIRSCTDCHTRTDLSKKSTLNGSSPPRSNYSNSASAAGHNPNSTILCIICHGPMHNISKPDITQRSIRNSDTESSHCSVCHATYSKHNASNISSGGLNCTLCHSDDIHTTQILGQDGSYITYNKINPNTTSGNCTSCHQNATYFNTLRSQPKAGNYSGRNPEVIRDPQLHSDAFDAGIRYGNYWWMQNQDASCRYCHGSSMHEPVGLGKPSLFNGNNIINSTIGNTTWCASCHYPGYEKYSNMTVAFLADGKSVPPSIIKGSNYFVKGRDHSIDPDFNDSYCYICHNGSTSYSRITPFMHEVYIGGGGPDCLSCHEIGSTKSVLHVNNSAMNLSIHTNLNNQSVNLYGVSADNKKCWGCHQTDGTQPGNTSMGDRFSSPYTCYDCHKNDGKPYPNVEDAGRVTNHIDEDSIITRIYTHNATCTTCHKNSVNLDDAKITDARIVSEKEGVSHYGSITSLVESIGDSSSDGCIYCHYNATNGAKWGKAHDPRSNPVQPHTATKNKQCYICHIQGELPVDFHNESMYYAGNGKIVLAANRYVILDDPNSGKAESTTGFSTPRNNWNTNYWSGKNTRINATALFIDRYGAPQSGSVISFTIYWPNGTALATINDTANAYGLANFSYDLNNKNYYGNWKIRATSGSVGANITFIYNWWGCSVCHGSENPGSVTPSLANSPYLSGRDRITNEDGDHRASNVNCTYCHSSYDGVPGGATFTTRTNKPSDVHRNISCNNVNCHGNFTQHNTNQRINSCYNSSCHSRNDISRKGTLNGINPDTALSIYSNNNAQSFNSTFHTPNSTVPCIICHGPMHSITKVDPSQRFIKNNDTEYNTCIACHQDYVRHNNSVNCPVCHSDDVHAIKVFAQNATYVTMNHNDPNPKRGNCSNCHQNSSFFGALLSQPKAGNYTGRYSPIMRSPVNHSEDSNAGSIWMDEGYWVKNDQISWCDYCHNNEMHAMSTLGKIKMFRGDNIVNSTIGNTSWCASCHWQGYANDSTKYVDMVDTFTGYLLPVPPEITGHALYAPTGRPGYFNHTISGYSDQDCVPCHSIPIGENARITDFTHNVRKGQSGGQNCTSCHNIGGTAGHDVDISNMSLGAHANLNNRSAFTGGNATNRKCWACHGTLNANGYANQSDQPVGDHNQSIYKKPRNCPDCHTNLAITTNFSAPQVIEHRGGAPVIKTNGTLCSVCHNNSLTSITETDGFGITSPQNATTSHYLKDANINLMTTTNHSNDCRWCHILNNLSSNWGTPFNPKNSSKFAHLDANVAQNENCYSCHGGLNVSVRLHNSGITAGAAGGVNCTSCHDIGGTAGHDVDIANMNNGAHANLNNHSAYTGGNATNRKCWSCHGTLNSNGFANESDQPDGTHNQSMYKLPRKCPDCHTNLASTTNFSAPQVIEHREGAQVIKTNGTLCSLCHNNSLTAITETDGFGITSPQNATTSHYLKDANEKLMTTSNHSNDCRWCHILNNVSTIWGTPFNPKNSTKYAHSDANVAQNSSCYACHGGLTSSVRLHNSGISRGAQGAPNCISCHYIGSQYPNIDVNAANISVHFGMNSFNATSKGFAPIVGACWACHDTDGDVTGGHPDKKDTPKVCDDCHVSGGAYYSQSVSWGGLTVSEHIKGGTDIKAGNSNSNIASCITCHENVTEMILSNNDPDTGSFAGDGMRLNGGNMSYYHYGRPRTDLRGVDSYSAPITDCTYCHSNATTAFTGAMLDPDQNKSIKEHSDESSNPSCYISDCHSKGWIHNSTLKKPIISNNGYCAEGCHAGKTSHNRTEFYCWYCHQDPNNPNKTNQKAPHGMMYPKTDGSFLMYNRSSSNANCTTCHIDGLVNTTIKPTRIPSLNHSKDPDSGKKWGNYWDNTSMLKACQYCHQSSNHLYQTSLLGNISLIKGTNSYKNPDLANSTWCANCHYAKASGYNANILSPVPPEITNSSLIAGDGTPFFNHSALSNFNDSNCKLCHKLTGSYLATSMNYSHSLDEGASGGINCTSCHYAGSTLAPNVDIVNMGLGVHANLNDRSQYTGGNATNLKCWACHGTLNSNGFANESDQPDGNHNQSIYQKPRKCPDCHTNLASTANFNAPQVIEHQPGAPEIQTTVKCSVCHNNSLTEIIENDGFGVIGGDWQNASVSHYATKTSLISTQDCLNCHNGPNTSNPAWGNPVNISTSVKRPHDETQNIKCDDCHKDSNVTSLALVDFHNASIQLASMENCISCHNIGGVTRTKVDPAAIGMHSNINNTDGGLTNADCWACHFNTTDMNTTYVVKPGVNVYLCNDCHLNQKVQSTKVSEHYPGANISVTTKDCENCHNNSRNIPDPASTVNTTIGNVTHYGTTTNLVKPTAGTYNTACNICHNSTINKTLYGVQNKQVTLGHISAATCDECHVNSSSSADTLHNVSLEMPVTNVCLVCHTKNADKYGAPNLTGTPMANYPTSCNTASSCHGTISGINSLDTLAKHNVDMTYPLGVGGSTDKVYLNNQTSLAVTKGAIVNITSRVNDRQKTGGASRIGGAEYYIGTDPGQGKGTPMVAADGYYDALQTTWENVTATIDTSSLSGGTYTIYVRGMDIGKQWSATKNATLIVQAFGYINGTVRNATDAPVIGAYVSTVGANFITGSDGKYSLRVTDGNYTVNANKQPEFYYYTIPEVNVNPLNTTTVDIVMDQKPTGTISGVVRNI